MATQRHGKEKQSGHSENRGEELAVLKIHVRPDLYRAFHRCVWMTVCETGMSIVEVHNKMIVELLRDNGC